MHDAFDLLTVSLVIFVSIPYNYLQLYPAPLFFPICYMLLLLFGYTKPPQSSSILLFNLSFDLEKICKGFLNDLGKYFIFLVRY